MSGERECDRDDETKRHPDRNVTFAARCVMLCRSCATLRPTLSAALGPRSRIDVAAAQHFRCDLRRW
jgi:hypothetical protein